MAELNFTENVFTERRKEMIRHIEFTINFDLTCWGYGREDFENDTPESIKEEIIDYINSCPEQLTDYIEIKKIWYEKDSEEV